MSGHCKNCGYDGCVCDDNDRYNISNDLLMTDDLDDMELFNIPLTKSPKLKWMERHCIKITNTPNMGFSVIHGMKTITTKPTVDEAITAAAKLIGIRLWNEQ